MNNPVFTVVTVTYNAEETLPSTLNSVFEQTYPHVEYILIDGGSQDQTMKIVRSHAKQFAHVISEPDHGLYDAMNKALPLASGDYVIFLNAGDRLHHPRLLSDIAKEVSASTFTPDVIYGQTILIDSNGDYLRMRHYCAPTHLSWRSFRHGMLVCHQAFWVKRDLTLPYNLKYRFSSDFDWCIRILKKSSLFLYTDRILIDYLYEGMTTRHHKASLWERFRIMTIHYGWFGALSAHLIFILKSIQKKLIKRKSN